MSTSQSLGRLIAERRRELGLTQDELAERIGPEVGQAEVSRLENNRVILPRRLRLEQIATALDIPIGELLVRSGWIGAERIEHSAATSREHEKVRKRITELEAQVGRHREARQRSAVEAELRQETIAALEAAVIQFRAVLNGIAVPVAAVNTAGVVILENTAYAVLDTAYSATPTLVDDAGSPIAEDATPLARAARGEQFTMSFTLAGSDPPASFLAQGQPVLADGGGLLGVVTFQPVDRA